MPTGKYSWKKKKRLVSGHFVPAIRFFILPVQLLSQLGEAQRSSNTPVCGVSPKNQITVEVQMILWLIFVIFITSAPLSLASNPPSFLCASVYPGACQQVKRRKDVGENRIRPGGKRGKIRNPKIKDVGGKGQSLLTHVLDKGRFVRLGQTSTLTPGKDIELRCKGNSIGWSYPTYLDTFNDSRLRCCCRQTSACLSWYKVDVNVKILYIFLVFPASSIKHSDKYSQLILTSPSAADTGSYSCWVIVCDGTECEMDHERIYASYIYFTGD